MPSSNHRKLTTAILCATALACPVAVVTPAAQADVWRAPAVSSPRCNTIKVVNRNSGALYYALEDGQSRNIPGRSSTTFKVKAGGDYYAVLGTPNSDDFGPGGAISVTRCPGSPQRPTDGDENGDGKADVLGIHGKTGNLYYYRMTNRGLARGVMAGSGWGSMIFMQRVNEIQGPGTGNFLLAIRNDGTLWRYANKGAGRLANGRQIASGLKGFSGFTITSLNTLSPHATYGQRWLLASRGGRLYQANIYKGSLGPMELADQWPGQTRNLAVRNFNNVGDSDVLSFDRAGNFWFHELAYDGALFYSPRRIGTGWNGMSIVASPGSFNGDRLSDLVARHRDGDLYTYTNKGGKWGSAVKIGTKWNGIRLLA